MEFDFIDNRNVDLELSDSYVWIETESQLKDLVDVLSKERAFAVDTEQHSLRSFLGFTALIQVIALVASVLNFVDICRFMSFERYQKR